MLAEDLNYLERGFWGGGRGGLRLKMEKGREGEEGESGPSKRCVETGWLFRSLGRYSVGTYPPILPSYSTVEYPPSIPW